MSELPQTIVETGSWLRSGRITSLALTEALLERCHATQETLAAFITFCDTSAREAARRADDELSAGHDRGPLHGVPIAVKDNIATRDAPTTANSHVLDDDWHAGADATVVRRLRDAGAVLVGKLGLYEFAVGSPDPDKGFPITRNPWNLDRIPGGSSSGAGAAVAAGLVLGALGTDTGGSIRVPAAYCGISGLRPTFGRVSNEGCVPVAHTLDTIGPMARTVHDCALLLQAIEGHDPADPMTARRDLSNVAASIPGTVRGVRIGVPKDYFFTVPELDAEVRAAVLAALDEMEAAGATVVEVEIPYIDEAYASWWTTTFAEKYTYHEPDLRRHPELYGVGARQSILTGAMLTSADYVQAQRVRTLVVEAIANAVTNVDVLVMPSTISPAPSSEDWNHFTTPSFTAYWSLVGYPAISVNCGFTDAGLPIGLQFVGKPFDEPTLLSAADGYQQISSWHTHRPVQEES